MSIRALIKDRVARGMLFPVLPRLASSPVRRALFATEGLWSVLTSPEGDTAWERRVAELWADLEVFVESEYIDSKYLFLLYPVSSGVWEIRSVRENPSIRVLGLFAAVDVFIATEHALREELGGWESREWKRVKRNAKVKWRGLFHPFECRKVKDVRGIRRLVTGAVDGKYFNRNLRDRDIFYFRQRQKNRVFSALCAFFAQESESRGINRKYVADILKKNPSQITRWLAEPKNLTLDTISDILLALGAEMDYRIVRFDDRPQSNTIHPAIVDTRTLKKPKRARRHGSITSSNTDVSSTDVSIADNIEKSPNIKNMRFTSPKSSVLPKSSYEILEMP